MEIPMYKNNAKENIETDYLLICYYIHCFFQHNNYVDRILAVRHLKWTFILKMNFEQLETSKLFNLFSHSYITSNSKASKHIPEKQSVYI